MPSKQTSRDKLAMEALDEGVRIGTFSAEVANAVTRSDTLSGILQSCVEAMVNHLDAAFARIWTLNVSGDTLELQASAGMYTHLNGAHGKVPMGKYKIGMIAQERRPHLTNAVDGDPRIGDPEWAKREGMVAFAGFPLLVDDRLVGVMAMFSRKPLSPMVLDAMALVAKGVTLGIERKRADQALRESEEHYRLMAESASDGIATIDHGSKILFVNRAAGKMFGYAPEELLNQQLTKLMPEHLRSAHAEGLRHFLATGEKRLHWTGLELPGLRKDGIEISLEVSFGELTLKGAQVFTGVMRDITERKKADQRLASQYAVTRILTEAGSAEEAIPAVLQAICEGLGWELGISWLVHEREKVLRVSDVWQTSSCNVEEFVAASRNRAFASGEGFPGHVWASGESLWLANISQSDFPRAKVAEKSGLCAAFAFPVRVGPKILGVMEFFSRKSLPKDEQIIQSATAFCNQIGQFVERVRAETDRARQAAELARSNADLEQFASIASHDLQEPLRTISSYVSLLEHRYKGKLDADADEFIKYAVDGAKRMSTLLNDLLLYSRVDQGEGKQFGAVDLERVFEWVLLNLHVSIQRNLAVVTHDPLPTVIGDQSQFTQLFQNIIANSIKYRAEDLPRIHVSAAKQEGNWILSVRDNGIGIDPEEAATIFGIFKRLHGREYPGTGVGLAICKKIVERHGGRIWIDSALGKGATFYFTIPFRHAAAAGPEGSIRNAELPRDRAATP